MVHTRERLIHHLGEHPDLTAGELGRALDLTPANIRYHLSQLLRQGLVQISGKRSPGGAGRPIHLYNLSSQALGENLEVMLAAVLESLTGEAGLEQAAAAFAARLTSAPPARGTNRVARYNQAVDFLNAHGYRASWGARPQGPQIELKHCPYRKLALSHPQICLIDQLLISSLCQVPMRLIRKRSFGRNPYSPCIFLPDAPGLGG